MQIQQSQALPDKLKRYVASLRSRLFLMAAPYLHEGHGYREVKLKAHNTFEQKQYLNVFQKTISLLVFGILFMIPANYHCIRMFAMRNKTQIDTQLAKYRIKNALLYLAMASVLGGLGIMYHFEQDIPGRTQAYAEQAKNAKKVEMIA